VRASWQGVLRLSGILAVLVMALVWAGPTLMAQAPATPTPTPPPAGGAGGAAGANAPSQPSVFSIIPLDGVTVTVVLLSTAAVALIIQGFIKSRQTAYIPPELAAQAEHLLSQRNYRELADLTRNDPSFLGKVLNAAAVKAPGYVAMREALETAAGEQTADSFRRIEFLNIIGNLGPLLGLLGTVLGMIQAFTQMQMAGGQANPAQLAGGISTALAHTFLGLALAVPCLAAFGILRTLTDRLTVRASLKADDLLAIVKPAEARAVAAPMPVATAAVATAAGVTGPTAGIPTATAVGMVGVIPPARQ
jgi:biopolymer transport protein ExbB